MMLTRPGALATKRGKSPYSFRWAVMSLRHLFRSKLTLAVRYTSSNRENVGIRESSTGEGRVGEGGANSDIVVIENHASRSSSSSEKIREPNRALIRWDSRETLDGHLDRGNLH